MTKAQIITAIRRSHLKANIDQFERDPKRWGRPVWSKARLDGGGSWTYLHVPIQGGEWNGTVQRVYPSKRLRLRLGKTLSLTPVPPRIIELAWTLARRNHDCAAGPAKKRRDGHRLKIYGPGGGGFDVCPHHDCRMVRQLLAEQQSREIA